jgi:Spy/CpxP family protein refolding chaperone
LGPAFPALAAAALLAAAETPGDPGTKHRHPAAAGSESLRSPYAAIPGTAASGLLPEEVEGLTKGQGMALALAAEVNGYPGPRHLLDAAQAGQLELPPDQRQAIQRIYDRMLAEAKAKGQEILQAEEGLATRFRHSHIDEESLRNLLGQIGLLRADLRFIHLRAHLETKAVLSPEQVARYNALRGYRGAAGSDPHRSH